MSVVGRACGGSAIFNFLPLRTIFYNNSLDLCKGFEPGLFLPKFWIEHFGFQKSRLGAKNGPPQMTPPKPARAPNMALIFVPPTRGDARSQIVGSSPHNTRSICGSKKGP